MTWEVYAIGAIIAFAYGLFGVLTNVRKGELSDSDKAPCFFAVLIITILWPIFLPLAVLYDLWSLLWKRVVD